MATRPETLHHRTLINQTVIDRTTLEELGKVETLWMYPPAHRVLGFICKPGLLGSKRLAFNLAQFHSLGSNGILVSAKPEETDGDRVRQLESLIQCEVWSDAGNRLGKIVDYQFNLQTGVISHYLFVANPLEGLTGSLHQLFPSQILSVGRKRIRVAEGQTFSVQRVGIQEKLAKASEWLKEDYSQITEDLRSTTEKAKERLQTLAEQAQERVQTLAEQAKETAHTLNERLQEETHTLVDQVKEQTETLTDQWEETLDSWENEADVAPAAEEDWDDWEKELDAWEAEVKPTEPAPAPEVLVNKEEGGQPEVSDPGKAADQTPSPAQPEVEADDEPWL